MMKRLICVGLALAAVAFSAFAAEPAAVPSIGLALDPDAMSMVLFGGMLVNAANLQSIFTGLKTIFNNALKDSISTPTPEPWIVFIITHYEHSDTDSRRRRVYSPAELKYSSPLCKK